MKVNSTPSTLHAMVKLGEWYLLHTYFQAIAIEGQQTNIVTDYVLKVKWKKVCLFIWNTMSFMSS
jgi:hypothetical protein